MIPLLPDSPQAADPRLTGGKAASLARLGALAFDVPPWFAIPPGMPPDPAALCQSLAGLGGERFAVRSSGMAEDGAGHSFAGQFDTFLNVPPDEVMARIEDVRRSASGAALAAYCRERDLPPPGPPAVLVQRMIDPRWAGVAFSADPVTGRRGVVLLAAVTGTADKLVAGETDGETWRLGPDDAILEQPAEPLLDPAAAGAVAALARRCETACGRPQDIEWAIDSSDRLWLLQSRPITTLGTAPDPDDEPRVWDNSNIAESYGGVTTPLTFSFARRIYEAVYREFCRLMSVPHPRLARAEAVFPQMLGLVRGRVYYNLASWYRVLALLPGFRLNRAFMEQMMGVREPLPEALVERIVAETRGSRLADLAALVRTCGGLLWRWAGLRGQIRRFRARLDAALAAPPRPLAAMRGEELAAHYRDLEAKLLKRWDAPLVNDFFAMIAYGVLRGLCRKWLDDRDGTLQNELLLDGGAIISAEPPRRIMAMARLARSHDGLPATLADPDLTNSHKLAAIRRQAPALDAALTDYLTEFGDRCLEELKLESPTVADDPASLLLAIGVMALRPEREEAPPAAPREVTLPWGRRRIFRFVLRQTRDLVAARENLRFERTRLFGRVRAVLRELGKRLYADGLLDDPQEVFYLELGELLAVWETTGTTAGLGSLARQRRAEFALYQASPAPPDRFQTQGPVSRHPHFEAPAAVIAPAGALTGTGACPGRVTGKVRIVLEPRGARLEPGEILVARQTDPGWVVLFPAAAGLLVERGSLLSHSAIVSRELRLPCIVSLPGITTTLRTGDLVEMDGTTGAVRLLERAPEQPEG